ncbi:hypothetical protein BBP40_003477 [Aspergillus hancockii]|nr:hypothetical protein BBP40_003477 [Aspergillus hancockii]
MEGCPSPASGAFCTGAVLVFALLLNLLAFHVFLQRVRVLITSMKPPAMTETTQSLDNDIYTVNATPNVSEAVVPHVPQPPRSSDLLDGSLDDIQVPVLLPLITRKMPGPASTSATTKLAEGLNLGGPVPLLDGGLDELTIPVLKPKRSIATVASQAANNSTPDTEGLPEVVPWDGRLRWAIEGPSVFDDEDDELGAFYFRPNLLSRHRYSDIWVFQYGLRYVPAMDDQNVYRTVRIENLPSNPTLKQILPAVSGEILSAHLADTTPITGSQTAIITFVWQSDAQRFIQTSKNGIPFGPILARVVSVNTPTYPFSAELKRLILKEGCTRCLCVSNVRGTLKSEIRRVLGKSVHANYIETIQDGYAVGEIYIRFHSIKVAAAAFELLKNHSCFTQCHFRFLKNGTNMRNNDSEEHRPGPKV